MKKKSHNGSLSSDDKHYSYDNNFNVGGGDDVGFKEGLIHSKFNYDLFSEEKALVVEKTIRCKRTVGAGKERWRLFENDDIIYVIEGSRLSKKEKEYLRTIDGFNFLIQIFKNNKIKSINQLKKELLVKLK